MISVANNSSRGGDKFITKRVLSAKEHRVKQLQNQLADAHFHLSELSNENRLLRNLQKRQDSALQRYENANGDIPRLINSHTEEIRSWQVRYKQLKLEFRLMTQRLKDKDFELQQLSDEHKHLLNLSKDGNLIEREKLQSQVAELKEKVIKQNEVISTLQRRINLEAKNFKHQLNAEMLKHKETQQQLSEAINHSDQLSSVIEMKEKMIAANTPKKTFPKISVGGSGSKTSINLLNVHSGSKHSMLPFQLSAKGNSSSDSQTSMESNSKSSRSSKSMFSVIGKSMQNNDASELCTSANKVSESQIGISKSSKTENDSSDGSNAIDAMSSEFDLVQAIRNGVPSMKMFESDTDAPRSSDDEVRERVEVMKRQLRKQTYDSDTSFERHEKNITYREVKKHSQGNISVTSEDSAQERYAEERLRPNRHRKPGSVVHDLGSEPSEQTEDNDPDVNLKTLDDFASELEYKENETVSVVPDSGEFGPAATAEGSIHNAEEAANIRAIATDKSSSELNNNSRTSRKVTTELNGEKKKKLLAALKAIDRGDDDGMHFDSLNKSKNRNKIIMNNARF